MRLGVLFSGGKDSAYAAWLAKEEGNEISCLISVFSKNRDSFMFHTPAIELTKKQAKLMGIPLLIVKTEGKKEEELKDLAKGIKIAIKKYNLDGIISGTVASNYQAERIKKICQDEKIVSINPLWNKDQMKLLEEIIQNKFEAIVSAVAAYPLGKEWIGKTINRDFLESVKRLKEDYRINPAGEGGEFESLVINSPLFKKRLKVKLRKVIGDKNSWRGLFV